MAGMQKVLPIVISNGTSLSNAALLGDHCLVGMMMSAGWDAASMTFQISFDNGVTWQNLWDDSGNEVTLAPTSPAGKYMALSPDPYGGIEFIKVRSGTSGSPVNQTADRDISLITRKVFPLR